MFTKNMILCFKVSKMIQSNRILIMNKFKHYSTESNITVINENFSEHNKISTDINWHEEMNTLKEKEIKNVLQPFTDDIEDITPNLMPTFNFAAYVNKSETLQNLVHLGVDLSKLEKRKGVPEFILKLDFKNDIEQHLLFLTDNGIQSDDLGVFLTKNPLIFKENMDDLKTRIYYLESKKFTKDMISRIVQKNPFWLMFSTQRIDSRLGYFQKHFILSGNEMRKLVCGQPRLITYKMESIRKNTFAIKEEMGFSLNERKSLLLSRPSLWMQNHESIIKRFDYIHNEMKISHKQIVQFPKIFSAREFKLKERHQFLKELKKDQFDPKLENYISLNEFIEGTDIDFCTNVAKCSIETYNLFLKTL